MLEVNIQVGDELQRAFPRLLRVAGAAPDLDRDRGHDSLATRPVRSGLNHVTHQYPELDGYVDFVAGTRGTPLGLDGTTPSMARMYDYYLGGGFYKPRGTRGKRFPTACRMDTGIRFAVFGRRLPPGRFSFQVRNRG